MKKIVFIHRDLLNPRTGGNYYLANTIDYFRRNYAKMEIIDLSNLFSKRKNRFLVVIEMLLYYVHHRENIFSFTNHNLYFYLLLPLFLSRIMSNKYGVACHLSQYGLQRNLLKRGIAFLCEYLFLHGASLLIIPSRSALIQFKAFKLNSRKTVIINPAPNITGAREQMFNDRFRNLIFVGNIEQRKGLDVLVRALIKLKQLNLHLDIIGREDLDRTYLKEIKELIEKGGIKDNVSFHGYLKPEEVADFYRKADLFVFPSRHETYGMVLVEAMSFGLPIIASSIPTTVEIIRNGLNGLLYETENVEKLIEAILRFAYDKGFRYSVIQNNLRDVKNLRKWEDVGRDNFEAITPFLR